MQHFSYFAKAYAAALFSGLVYLMANIAPTATHLSDISLLVWIGFAAAILGSFGVTAVVTNGPNPADIKQAQADAEAAKQTALAASASNVIDLSNVQRTFPAAAVSAAQAAKPAPIDVQVKLPEPSPVPIATPETVPATVPAPVVEAPAVVTPAAPAVTVAPVFTPPAQ